MALWMDGAMWIILGDNVTHQSDRGDRTQRNRSEQADQQWLTSTRKLITKIEKELLGDRRGSTTPPVIFSLTTQEHPLTPRSRLMRQITVYTKPACAQCGATFKVLDKAGMNYRKIDVTKRPGGPRIRHGPGVSGHACRLPLR